MKQGLKDYSEILSDDEFAQVCRMGNPDELRKIYARHPRAFTDLMPGFRANTLTDEQAYSVITKHRKDPFAKYVFDVIVASLMRSFYETLSTLQGKGIPYHEALIEALAHSKFSGKIGLYCKLKGEEIPPEEIKSVEYEVRLYMINEKYTKKLTDMLSEIESRCGQAEAKCEVCISSLKDTHAETQTLLSQSEHAAKELHSLIEDCNMFGHEHEQLESAAQEVLDALDTILQASKKVRDLHIPTENNHAQPSA